jgi:hypothetical protein
LEYIQQFNNAHGVVWILNKALMMLTQFLSILNFLKGILGTKDMLFLIFFFFSLFFLLVILIVNCLIVEWNVK